MRVTPQVYGQFLGSSLVNYIGNHLANYLDGPTHDTVRYFLETPRFTSHQLCQQVRPQKIVCARGCVLFDDTVFGKSHRRRIEPVRHQHSGNAYGVSTLTWKPR